MKRKDSGFSLVELLIAMAIILIGVSAVVPLYVYITQASESNRLRSVATNLANETLEEVRSKKFHEVGVVDGEPAGPFLSSEVRSIDGKNYTIQIFINWLEEGSSCLSSDPVQGSWDYKGVRVTVTAPSVFTGEQLVSATNETIIARDASQPAQPGANIRTCMFRGWRPDLNIYDPVSSVRVDLTFSTTGTTSSAWSTSKGSTLFVNRPVGTHTVTVDPSTLGMIVEPGTSPFTLEAVAASTSTKLVLVEYPCSINVQFVDEEGDVICGSGKLTLKTLTDDGGEVIDIINDFTEGQESVLVTGIWPVGAGYSGAYSLKVENVDGYEDYDMSIADIKPFLAGGDPWDGKFSAPGTEINITVELKKEIVPFKDNLVLHLDADAISELNDGDKVATWSDLSAKDNHATRPQSDHMPTYRAIDGESFVQFNGGNNELLETPLGTDNNFFFADSSTNWTIALVFRCDGDNNQIIAGAAGGIGQSTTFAIYTNNGNVNVRLRGHNNHSEQIVGSNIATEEWHQIVVTWDGTTATGYFNGGEGVVLPVGFATIQNYRYYLGSSRRNLSNYPYFTGDIAENIVYDTDLSSEDRETLEKYLGEKWLGWTD